MAHRAAEAGPSWRPASGTTFVRRRPAVEGEESEGEGSEVDFESGESTEAEYQDALPSRGDGKGKAPASAPPRSASPTAAKKSSSWADLDLSIIVALLSPIGNWLTGGDHVKNAFLVILLILYLHQIIEIPWQLYLAARPRQSGKRVPSRDTNDDDDDKTLHFTSLAETELRWYELLYLGLATLSPFVGAIFLRYVLTTLGDRNTLSWFSTTLFVLATGLRPWRHLIARLKDRTRELHTALHYPDEESLAHLYEKTEHALYKALRRIDALEEEARSLREAVKRAEKLRGVCNDLHEAIEEVERAGKRNERKADAHRAAQGVRIAALEQGLVQLEERRKRDVAAFEAAGIRLPDGGVVFHQARSTFKVVLDKVLAVPRAIIVMGLEEPPRPEHKYSANGHPLTGANGNGFASGSGNGNGHVPIPRIRSPDREKHLLTPRLATIPEADNSDSEETFVSDKENPTSPGASAPAQLQRSPHARKSGHPGQSRGVGGSGDSGKLKAMERATSASVSASALDYAQIVVLWPYRFSVRAMVMVLPPMKNILPRV